MRRKTSMLFMGLAVAVVTAQAARGATIQFLTPAGSSTGIAYGVDGLNVVGQDVAQRGFYYNGATNKYTVIQPGKGTTAALGISGDKIVGLWGKLAFIYDGSTYSTLSHPLGVNGTAAAGIDGDYIVGWYTDASGKRHGFLYDGSSYTTIDAPLGAQGTVARGISGSLIVGTYDDANSRTHGFSFDGTTYTTLDDPLLMGMTAANGVDGTTIVGYTINSPFSAAFIYDGASYSHPFSIEGVPDHVFYGVSGDRIVGEYNDRPFVYIIPEPSSLLLAMIGAACLAVLSRRHHAAPRY